MSTDKNLLDLNQQLGNVIPKPFSQIISRLASEIELQPINWLWPRRFAKGKISSYSLFGSKYYTR